MLALPEDWKECQFTELNRERRKKVPVYTIELTSTGGRGRISQVQEEEQDLLIVSEDEDIEREGRKRKGGEKRKKR